MLVENKPKTRKIVKQDDVGMFITTDGTFIVKTVIIQLLFPKEKKQQ